MAALALEAADRRAVRRLSGGGRFGAVAVLRPGQPVVLVNISSQAALVESATRMRPGAFAELQLGGSGARASVRGRVERCHVVGLDPLRYHGLVLFEEPIDVGAEAEGSE